VAATAEALLVVTGNLRHFPKKVCRDAQVIGPMEFLELLRCAKGQTAMPPGPVFLDRPDSMLY
jgi:hypothetical protein